jgi:hypothetical protein
MVRAIGNQEVAGAGFDSVAGAEAGAGDVVGFGDGTLLVPNGNFTAVL